jgi:demethylmenaquinone methyltransferase / 2-methoxy-6-polyprenyl-1,4-benzoquinol methylase
MSERTRFARQLFGAIAPEYDRMGAIMSFGQDPSWRRFLVSRVNAIPGSWVLDVATGTGLVARELARHRNVRIAALDQSEPMVRRGIEAIRKREGEFGGTISFLLGQAERLPFPDETFDSVTFTYLLRYVDDPGATLHELARVLRPGGTMAGLEFHVPHNPYTQLAWRAYTRTVMPTVGWIVSRGWQRTGQFLGPSIERFYERYPLPVQVRMWQEAGIVKVRSRTMAMGAGIVIWGVRRTAVAAHG